MPAARNTLSRIIVNVDVYVVVHVDVDGFLKPFCFETAVYDHVHVNDYDHEKNPG